MEKIQKLLIKYKSFLLYVFFGGCTTLVNIIAYAICARAFHLGTVISNIVAWILAVTFAYVTNRSIVFESEAREKKAVIGELISFFSCRLLTGGLDLLMMYVFVDMVGVNDLIMKIISNIIVIILNYIASKLLIFRHGGQNEQEV